MCTGKAVTKLVLVAFGSNVSLISIYESFKLLKLFQKNKDLVVIFKSPAKNMSFDFFKEILKKSSSLQLKTKKLVDQSLIASKDSSTCNSIISSKK